MEIKNISDAIKVVKDVTQKDKWLCETVNKVHDKDQYFSLGIWYRGHSRSTYTLTPSVFRVNDGKVFDEVSMFHHFQLRMSDYRKQNLTTFDWLTLMQHYGLPTRLLDWTESILVALYFACNDYQDEGKDDGTIYVLHARQLNKNVCMPVGQQKGIKIPESFNTVIRTEMARRRNLSSVLFGKDVNECDEGDAYAQSGYPKGTKIIDILKTHLEATPSKEKKEIFEAHKSLLNLPIAVYPYRNNGRMIAQYSMFTLQGGIILTDPYYTPEEGELIKPIFLDNFDKKLKEDEKILKKYLIKKENKSDIIKELKELGIHEGTLFPEADNQSSYIQDLWKYNLND